MKETRWMWLQLPASVSCRLGRTLRWSAALLAVALSTTSPAAADDLLYSLLAQSGGSGQQFLQLNISSVDQLAPAQQFEVLLPDGRTTTGTMRRIVTESDQGGTKGIISLAQGSGGVELVEEAGRITTVIIHDTLAERIYKAELDIRGLGAMEEEQPDDYYCVKYPVAENGADEALADSPSIANAVPSVAVLQNLQSRPGAPNIVYINYWGGVLSGTAWNDNHNDGEDIVYTPYSYDEDTTTFSETDRYLMWLGWREAAEDYAPFDVNVTTSQAVYNATPVSNRVQVIATTTNYFYPGYGGVAYLNIFHNSSDYYKTAWVWNRGSGSLGMTISHESGHQVGLGHDGISSSGYYEGHGLWGPIMGAPFYKSYVQWSQGEYPDANNSEDDLQIIQGVLGVVPDEAGNTMVDATALPGPVPRFEGLITPEGVFGDVDVYRMWLPGYIELTIQPLLGAEGESRAANLAMDAILRDSTGSIVAEMHSDDVTPLAPDTNKLEYFSDSLPAGEYYLSIEGVSPDTDWSTGFGEYGNGGQYRMDLCWDPIPTVILPSNVWQQYSLPGDPGSSNTVADIFGDDIPGVYGQAWILYRYNPENNVYTQLTLADTLAPGEGFWIIQTSGDGVLIDMPASTVIQAVTAGQGCISENGCYSGAVSAQSGGVRWSMIGYPFPVFGEVDTMRIATDSSGPVDNCALSDGCTLAEARAASIFSDVLWHYVDGVTGYRAVTTGDVLSPWEGYWSAALGNAVPGATWVVIPRNDCQGGTLPDMHQMALYRNR